MRRIISVFVTASILFLFTAQCVFSQDKYSPREKEYMLNLSREALTWYLKYKQTPDPKPEELTDNLREKRPCFVTLTKKGDLRGCIGLFEFNRPLYKNIIERAILAATQDIRFPNSVSVDELKDIKIEISILTEPKELKFASPEDLLSKLTPFQDGIILSTEYGNSTYLPQVWEQIPQKEEFLSSLCMKHGAPANYWKTNYKNLKVETYQAIHFEEESAGIKRIVGPKGAVVGKGGAKVIGAVALLKEGLELGGYIVKEGTQLRPGAIVTEDSDIIEK